MGVIRQLKLSTAVLLLLVLTSVAVFRVCRRPLTALLPRDIVLRYGVPAGLIADSDNTDSNGLGSHNYSDGISTLEEHGHQRSLELDSKEPTTPDTRYKLDHLSHGYVLSLHYPGQQGAGLSSLTALQCSIGSLDLPMFIVEPFINASHLSPWGNDTLLTVHDYFDINHLNAASRKIGYAELATWDEFLQKAPRNVVFLELHLQPHGPPTPPVVTWTANGTSTCRHVPVVDNVLKEHGFCVVRTVSKTLKRVIPRKNGMVLTGQELYKQVLGEWKPHEVTLVVPGWWPPWYILNLQSPNKCEQANEEGLHNRFHPSQKLLALAKRYEELHLGSNHHFGVAAMLRVEHAIRLFRTTDQQLTGINACLQQVVHLVEDLQGGTIYPQTFVTADIGKYGSGTWYDGPKYNTEEIFGTVKSTLELLTRNMTFEEWEDSFSIANNVTKDRGYVAALQRTIAGRSDCLVLMGRGNFLKLALHDYLNNHPDPATWCIHFVCPDGSNRPNYVHALEDRRSVIV